MTTNLFEKRLLFTLSGLLKSIDGVCGWCVWKLAVGSGPPVKEEEEDLPKLDGAPIEAKVKKFSYTNTNKQTPGLSSQERVLARLYNK